MLIVGILLLLQFNQFIFRCISDVATTRGELKIVISYRDFQWNSNCPWLTVKPQ